MGRHTNDTERMKTLRSAMRLREHTRTTKLCTENWFRLRWGSCLLCRRQKWLKSMCCMCVGSPVCVCSHIVYCCCYYDTTCICCLAPFAVSLSLSFLSPFPFFPHFLFALHLFFCDYYIKPQKSDAHTVAHQQHFIHDISLTRTLINRRYSNEINEMCHSKLWIHTYAHTCMLPC